MPDGQTHAPATAAVEVAPGVPASAALTELLGTLFSDLGDLLDCMGKDAAGVLGCDRAAQARDLVARWRAHEALIREGEAEGVGCILLALPRAFPAAEVVLLSMLVRERLSQIRDHHWTPEHDDAHPGGEMAQAGAAYLLASTLGKGAAALWPWEDSVQGFLRRQNRCRGMVPTLDEMHEYLVRKPRLDQLVTGVTLGFAEAAREMRAAERARLARG